MNAPDEWYWRYEDTLHSAGVDEFEFPRGPAVPGIALRRYRVVRRTPCGVRLDNGRFVFESATKHFACPTPELARLSYVARKERQIRLYEKRLEHARERLRAARREPPMFGYSPVRLPEPLITEDGSPR